MLQTKLFSALAASALLPAMAQSQSLIVNEYNGVTDTKFFDLAFDEAFEGRDYGLFFDATAGAGTYIPTSANADDDGSDPRWDLIPTAVDMQGRILGNGGNWIELVVTEDNLDLRGWSLEWSNADTPPDNAGTVTFSNDARWSNLRSGTIVTIIETPDDLVPTLPVTFPDGTTGTAINVDTDFNTTPDTGDFSVNAWLGDATMFTTGDWKVDNDDWRVTIKDDLGVTVQGPIGEDVQGYGVNSREIARLEADPIAGLNPVSGYDDGDYSTFGAPNQYFDNTVTQDFDSLRGWWINRIVGDADLDGDVDLNDGGTLVTNFGQTTGQFWADGNFDGDGDVDLNDGGLLVANFGTGLAPAASEPISLATAGDPAEAEWDFEATVDGLSTTITVDAAGQAFLSTEALDVGVTLTLLEAAVPFSAQQAGPGAQVGELLASNFITGTESILVEVDDLGTYNFLARWNVLGGQEQSAQFSITFVPEPSSLALIGIGSALLARRRQG
ncbi:MAG: PEP-CTERM sorting domain-containing protein [Planctomycetota bacterium]